MQTELKNKLSSGHYDFIDFGCSKGDSLVFGRDHLGGRNGLGIDIDPKKVQTSIERGEDALVVDATEVGSYKNAVSFSIMAHFLEHLPGLPLAMKCIESAVSISRDFVFIRQPWFDADGQLLQNELKLYWSDWGGHQNPMTTLDFYRAIRRLKSKKPVSWAIDGSNRIYSSASKFVLPLNAPANRHFYDPQKDGRKHFSLFNYPVYQEIICVIQLSNRVGTAEIMNFARNNRFPKGSLAYRVVNSKPVHHRKLQLIASSEQ
ncbi:hypothetical protein [Microvirga roseola]|uniref:hypothetical protein n=1 Tax=Microvirga roseola TaxID=2883126 RepID=UPI001E5C469A|nr:hypothetical protein [Microvirga roseola]